MKLANRFCDSGIRGSLLRSRPPRAVAVALLLAAMLAATGALAHEPGTIQVSGLKAATTGVFSFEPDARGKGDTQVLFNFKNADPEMDVLLVFSPCSFEGEGSKRFPLFQVADLDRALSPKTPEDFAVTAQLDPAWSLCQLGKSELPGVFLLRRGETLGLKMSLDFLPGARLALDTASTSTSGPVSKIVVRSPFDVFAVRPEESGEYAQALLGSRRPRSNQVAAILDRVGRGGPGESRQWLTLVYELAGDPTGSPTGTFRRAPYEELFVPQVFMASPAEGQGTTTVGTVFALDEYRTPRKVIPAGGLVFDTQHSSVFQIDTTSDGPSGGQICEDTRPDCTAYPTVCMSRVNGTVGAPETGAAKGSNALSKAAAATYTITGRFSVKWTDHALHPGWAWVAVAWWNDSGTWRELASDWVSWDGSYTLTVNRTGYAGQNLRVQFRAYNRFYEPRTASDGLFRWNNPDKTAISTFHDEGHRSADCDGGTANGIGEMYHGAYLLWSKLYWTGEINPLRANPLKVYFPNTSYDCGDGSGIPWSCANCSGTVWLTAAHGVQFDIVQHEFAHQVHYEFWNNHFPTGSCLSHSICTKYNKGLALTEGYADFVPAWVGCNRGDASCTASYGREIESSACVSSGGNTNEWNVAQTFHDLWDSHADGVDVLHYVHEGAAQKIFLSNGLSGGNCCGNGTGAVVRGMSDYQATYRSQCSAGHETYIDKIFEQNLP
jgi:hypothetical protein